MAEKMFVEVLRLESCEGGIIEGIQDRSIGGEFLKYKDSLDKNLRNSDGILGRSLSFNNSPSESWKNLIKAATLIENTCSQPNYSLLSITI